MTLAILRKVVFIDPGVLDIEDLLNGLAPDTQAFVLDPGSDGLQQIANILATDDLTDLSSISIVGHGASGEIRLGSSSITDGNLADHAAALAALGTALTPCATIQLYGCDVASGTAGQQFIDDFSTLTGGATVEAATHLVGDAAGGGSFTLDAAATGGAPLAASSTDAPFTSDAIADFQGSPTAEPDGQLFFRINQGNLGEIQLGHINSDGTNRGTIYYGGGNTTSVPPSTTGTGNETSVAVDTAAGLVFSVGIGNKGSYDAFSVHDLNTGALISTTEFGANTGSALTDDVVQALTINPFTQTLYVDDWGTTTSVTGIRQFSYSSTGTLTPLATNGGFLVTSAQLGGGFSNANALYLDRSNNRLYYIDDDSGYNFSPFQATNGVYVYNLTSQTTTELTSNGSGTGQFPTADQSGSNTFVGPHGNLVGLTEDVAHGIVYFESTDATGSANNALWRVSATGGANQTATQVTLPAGVTFKFAGQSNEGGNAAGLSFDSQLNQLYLTDAENSISTSNTGAIYVLQMDSSGNALSLVRKLDVATLTGIGAGTLTSEAAASTTFFDLLPTMAVSGTGTSPTEQSTTVTLLTGAPTITDADGNHLASATLQITGGTFSSNENSTSDDHLTVLDGATSKTSGTYTGTNIAISYNSATETLTLSGYDTITNYQAVLSHVQYNTTGDNPTNYGSNTTRTIQWTASDGALSVASGSQNSGTTAITITAANDAPVISVGVQDGTSLSLTETNSGLSGNHTLTVKDPDSTSQTITTSLVSHTGDTSGITDATLTGFLSAGSPVSTPSPDASGTITYTFNSGTQAFDYLPAGGTLSITYNIHDVDSADTGASLSADQQVTVTITGTNDSPTVIGTNPEVLTAILEDSQPAGQSISSLLVSNFQDADSSGSLAAIAVTTNGSSVSTGQWQYSSDGGTSWSNIGAASTAAAVLIHATSLVRFLPAADFNGSAPTLTVQLVDDTQASFTDGATTSLVTTGGTTPYSTATVSLTQSVTAVNDAPVASGSASLTAINEDTASPPGATVSALFSGNFSDAADQVTGGSSANTFAGIAISDYTVDASAGNWQYSTNSGANWTSLGSATTTGAITLNATDLLRFVPAANYNGSSTALAANLIESGQSITSGATIDLTGATGGSTHISSATVALLETITAVNDPPVLAGIPASAGPINVGDVFTLASGATVTDLDSADLVAATVSVAGGIGDTLSASTSGTSITAGYNGVTEILTLSGTDTLAHYQQVLDTVAFQAASAGTTRTISWVLDDGSALNNLSATQDEMLSVACYCRGTLILTDRGEVAVEELAIGDRVMTLSGATKPIRWIGHRAYDGRFVAGNKAVLPICVATGALADGVPSRDLWVSPGHSLYIGGVLLQSEHLLNGATIVQADSVEQVEYFHIELDTHDILLADGAPAEGYVDCDNRLMFANGADYARLYPDDDRPRWAFCVPKLGWDSAELEPIRAALLARAETLGHMTDFDPDLHLLVDGAIVRPASVGGDVYRFFVPASAGAVWLASRTSVPAEVDAASRDTRRLGVPVTRVALGDGELSIEAWHNHAALGVGFHADEGTHRWTDGMAQLPEAWLRLFPGAFSLEVGLGGGWLPYRLQPPARTRDAA